MINILNALIPVFSLILIGYFFKKIKFPSYEFWPMADKLTYYVLMPSLLIYKLSKADIQTDNISFVLTPILTILIITFVLIFINKFFKTSGESFTSTIQGAIRFNTYIFLALADSIYGDEGLVLAAIILTFLIPFINVVCITIFAIYVNNSKLSFLDLLKSIITNPLIIACAIGGSISYLGVNVPEVLNKSLSIISSAALPMGLLSVGFALVLKEIKDSKQDIIISTFAKLILFPLIVYAFAKFFNLNEMMSAILILFAATATAPSSFILARQLGGNVKLMSSIITVQTLLSIGVIIFALEYLVNTN